MAMLQFVEYTQVSSSSLRFGVIGIEIGGIGASEFETQTMGSGAGGGGSQGNCQREQKENIGRSFEHIAVLLGNQFDSNYAALVGFALDDAYTYGKVRGETDRVDAFADGAVGYILAEGVKEAVGSRHVAVEGEGVGGDGGDLGRVVSRCFFSDLKGIWACEEADAVALSGEEHLVGTFGQSTFYVEYIGRGVGYGLVVVIPLVGREFVASVVAFVGDTDDVVPFGEDDAGGVVYGETYGVGSGRRADGVRQCELGGVGVGGEVERVAGLRQWDRDRGGSERS